TALDNNGGNYYTFVTPEKPPTAPPSVEWPTFHNNVPRQGKSPSNFQPPIDLVWKDGPFLLQLWNGPVLSDGILFSAPLDGTLRARDPFTGEILWSRHLGDQYYYTPTMVGHDGVLYAPFYGSAGGHLYALNEYTGDTIWVDGSESGLDFNARIMMGYSGTMYALDAFTGATVWSTGGFNLIDVSTPAYDGTAIYFGDFNSEYVALDAADGSLIWRSSVSGPVATSPALANGFLYGTCWYCPLYTFDTVDGSIVDTDSLTSSIGSPSFPAVSAGWIWVEAHGGNITGF